MPQATKSSRLRRVAMGGICQKPESQVKPPGKLLKSREHPASLAKMCIYRCKLKALAKLNSLKAAVSQRNKFLPEIKR